TTMPTMNSHDLTEVRDGADPILSLAPKSWRRRPNTEPRRQAKGADLLRAGFLGHIGRWLAGGLCRRLVRGLGCWATRISGGRRLGRFGLVAFILLIVARRLARPAVIAGIVVRRAVAEPR